MNPVEAVPARDPAAPEPMPAELTLKAVEEEMPPLLEQNGETWKRRWDPGALSTCPAIRTSGTVYRYRAVKGDVRGLRCVEAHGGGGRKYWVHEKMSVCWGTSAVESYRKRTVRLLYPHQTLSVPPSLSDSHTHAHWPAKTLPTWSVFSLTFFKWSLTPFPHPFSLLFCLKITHLPPSIWTQSLSSSGHIYVLQWDTALSSGSLCAFSHTML